MKVGFDGRYAEGNLAGIGKYIKYLSTNLSNLGVNCVIFYSKIPKSEIKAERIESTILASSNRYIFEQVLLPKALKVKKIDVYHATGNVGVPLFSSIPSVLTIHDIIPLEIKNYFQMSRLSFLSKLSYRLRLKTSYLKAKKVITISEYIKHNLANKLCIPENKIVVIHSGIIKGGVKGVLPFGLVNKKFILNHGGIDIRKNLERLIEAFGHVHLRFPDYKLVITGENKFLKPKLDKLVKRLKLGDSVIFPGYVDEQTLWTLIKHAMCICYPTLMEGFGQPVLEGFISEIPVISSKSTSIPEIAGDAALLVKPKSVEGISTAIQKILRDKKLVTRMVIKGKKEVMKYKWEKTAQMTLKVYKDVLK